MEIFVQGIGNVSAQRLDAQGWPVTWTQDPGDRFRLHEPDYAQLFDPKIIRRMSRVIRMGVAAAHQASAQAGPDGPTAIIAGTAYGCLADTEVFLRKMIAQDEAFLSPTAFIQSTHNTVAGQIAMMLQCHGHNNTFVHRGLSFEHALLDAALLLHEDPEQRVLVGGVDEVTETSLQLLKRFGVYRGAHGMRGLAAGEGASFFLLSAQAGSSSCAVIREMALPAEGTETALSLALEQVLSAARKPVDLVLHGDWKTPDSAGSVAAWLAGRFDSVPRIAYKPFCGEYPTASAFGLWMAAGILGGQALPSAANAGHEPVRSVLLVNNWLDRYHSLILLEDAALL